MIASSINSPALQCGANEIPRRCIQQARVVASTPSWRPGEVFARRGYRRTQMADVAGAMGVSPGNLYNCVDSMDASFYLVLRRMLGERTKPKTS